MSFVSHFVDNLIGSGKSAPSVAQTTASTPAPAPRPPPAAPVLDSGDVEASARENMARLRRRKGFSDTILGSGMGDTGGAPQNNIQRTTLLGGGGGSY